MRFAGESEDDEAQEVGTSNAVTKKEETKNDSEPVKKKSFFYDDGDTALDWNVVELPTWGDRGIGSDQPLPAKIVKDSCWQCYRMFPEV